MPVLAKPTGVVVASYLPAADAAILRERAEAGDRTVSAEIRRAVRLYLRESHDSAPTNGKPA